MEDLLKLQHSPAIDPRNGRRASVREHRSRLEIEQVGVGRVVDRPIESREGAVGPRE
jgi:hypothetical protein